MTGISRRALIKGVAATGAATWVATAPGARALAAGKPKASKDFSAFTAIAPSSADELQVPPGYVADVLIKWGDEFGDGLRFGYNCDYTAFFPLDFDQDEGLLWVNHEYVIPWYVSSWLKSQDPSWDPRVEPYASIMANEKSEVGGSIVHVKQRSNGTWRVVPGSWFGRRFTAAGPLVPYDGPVAGTGLVPDEGVLGTLANCSGGTTPWGTVLTAEENYQSYGLERNMPFNLGWDNAGDPDYYAGEVQPQPPGPNARNAYRMAATEVPNYGYIVEINPYTGRAVKHTALGRIHHENVTMRIARDRRIVAYTGDDAPAADGMLFRFVSSRRLDRRTRPWELMQLLSDGQLYVAQFLEGANNPEINSGTGRWHPLDMTDPDACAFTTQWVRTNIIPAVGGTTAQFHVPRAEDCEILPNRPQDIAVSLTSARRAVTDPATYGALRVLHETVESPDGLQFTWHDIIEGGPESGVANPDNMAFSGGGAFPGVFSKGSSGSNGVWLTSDISTSALNPNSAAFAFHGNNALYHVPLSGPNANLAFRFANAPARAELTGPTFVDRARTLFLSVQHPGEPRDADLSLPVTPANFTSYWPEGNKTTGANPTIPKPSVVTIRKVG